MHGYAKGNSDDKRVISSYLLHLDINNFYGWAMSRGFEWEEDLFQFNESFIKNYDEKGDSRYFFEVDVEYPKKLFNNHKDLPERKTSGKVKKLVCDIQDEEKYVVHIRPLKKH